MPLYLYNTMGKEKQEFVPLRPGYVGLYVCGPTVYDHAHIGHARSAVVFDVLRRYLRFQGMRVSYARNFTDIDDKIVERSSQMGIRPEELARTYIDAYREDMETLNVEPPDFEPRVSAYVDHMCALISRLIEKDHAYATKEGVLFRVDSRCGYGVLSGVPARDRSKGGLMGQSCTSKESSRDFALWKTTPANGCGWESPWGRGRPGWHIECVAMSQTLLGNPFDIHGGGCDLVFPHHENELAISRSLAGSELARYWMHHGLVTAGGRKISKSDGFPVRIRDLCRRYHPEAVRLFLLSTHYRRPLDFSHHHLSAAVSALKRMNIFLNRCGDLSGEDVRERSFRERPFSEQFCRDVDNDFNIPAGISQIFSCMRRMNHSMDEAGGFRGLDDCDKVRISEMVTLCRDVLGILGDSG